MPKELIFSSKTYNGKWICSIVLTHYTSPTQESVIVSGFRTRCEARARCREMAAAIKREDN